MWTVYSVLSSASIAIATFSANVSDEEQIPNSEEEQAGMNFVNSLKTVNPQEIENDFTTKFEEILKNPDKIIEVETEAKGSAMAMFAI